MKKDTILFVSLDTHKKFHHAAYVEDGRGKTPIDYGQIPGSKIAITKLLRKLQSRISIVPIDNRGHTNAAIRGVCMRWPFLRDKMGGTTIYANGQRVQRRSAWHCYALSSGLNSILLSPLPR